MEDSELVRIEFDDESVFYIEGRTVNGSGETERDIAGVRPDLDAVVAGVRRFAAQVSGALEGLAASKYTMEFGCEIAVESGTLVAVLGKGSAKSQLKVSVEWSRPDGPAGR